MPSPELRALVAADIAALQEKRAALVLRMKATTDAAQRRSLEGECRLLTTRIRNLARSLSPKAYSPGA